MMLFCKAIKSSVEELGDAVHVCMTGKSFREQIIISRWSQDGRERLHFIKKQGI